MSIIDDIMMIRFIYISDNKELKYRKKDGK